MRMIPKKYPFIYCLTVFFLFLYSTAFPQKDSSVWEDKPVITFSGCLDVFYAYDFNNPSTCQGQPFLYNYNRYNEFNLNFGLIKLNVTQTKYRANLGLQAGTYVIDNYAAEPAPLQHIYEGNAGFSLNKKNNLWLDAGIFNSHIGFESVLSKDNRTLTRSILGENTPSYLAGAKLTYNPNEHWEMAAIFCNGWQRIKKVAGNT